LVAILLVTVFSYGGWAPLSSDKYDIEKVSTMRSNEDEEFAAEIGAKYLRLGLTDAGSCCTPGDAFNAGRWLLSVIRGDVVHVGSAGENGFLNGFETGLEGLARRVPTIPRWNLMKELTRLDTVYGALKLGLSQIFTKFPDATIASPLGLGLHPDHVMVASACRSLGNYFRSYYYEDLPYAASYRAQRIRQHVASLVEGLRPALVNVSSQVDAKIDNLGLYRSQMTAGEIANVRKYAMRLNSDGHAYERIWLHETFSF
jgi:LmbE family N-acetylglucosaminyl deacetylase